MKNENSKYLLGLDAGTTSIKGVIVDAEKNQIVASSGKEYQLEMSEGEICELDPKVYWETTIDVIKSLLKETGISGDDILSVAFSSQGETLICVDENGTPLRKAIVWLDNRSEKEAKEISDKIGVEKISQKTGQQEILPLWPATRIQWFKNHEPHIFKKVHKYLLVEDYLMYCLSGKYYSEESLVSSTLYYDIIKKEWWNEMLSFLEISKDQLPEVLESGKCIGNVTDKASKLSGLSIKTKVVTGAYDHPAGAIGAGNIEAGMISETTGASMAMVVTLDKPFIDKEMNLPCQLHAVPGKYLLLPYGQTAGMVFRWFRDNFCKEEIQEAEKTGKDAYSILAKQAEDTKAGSEGLVILPHLMGAGSPEFDPNAKGVFYGLTLKMGKAHFVRAIMESIAYMINANINTLTKRNIKIDEIRGLGGAANSELWNQIKADVFGMNYTTLSSSETASLGAAILAGVGAGFYKSIEEGCFALVETDRSYKPNKDNEKLYDEMFRKYIKLYKLTSKL